MAAKKKPTGKRQFETEAELAAACEKYFKKIDETGEVPSEAGLALHLGVSLSTLIHWFDGDYSTVLQEAVRDAYNVKGKCFLMHSHRWVMHLKWKSP